MLYCGHISVAICALSLNLCRRSTNEIVSRFIAATTPYPGERVRNADLFPGESLESVVDVGPATRWPLFYYSRDIKSLPRLFIFIMGYKARTCGISGIAKA